MNNNIQNGFNGYNNYNNYEIPMNPAQMYQPNQIVRPMAPTVPTMPGQMPMTQQNPMMNAYNQFNQFGYNLYGMPQTTPMPTVPAVMNPTVPGQMPVMPNQFNARTPMANTTPMVNQQMMYQNPMARTNPMMGTAMSNPMGIPNNQMMNGMNMMGQQYTNPMMAPQYGIAQPNMNMMNGYANGYNQYNNFGMPPVATQSTMSVMNPTAASMVNQPAHNREINDPTPVSKQELIKKVEKDLLLKKECKDFTFIVTRTNEIYIFFKRRNKEWIKKFSGTLWNGCDIKIICEGDVVYIPLAVNSYEEFILDNELLIFLEKLRPNFFLKKLVKSNFIKINGQIICINSDNLLEKYEKYDHSYFFISSERNQLVQDFSNALTNDDYLFIDEKTKKRNTFDSLPRLKELENYFEEVKDYEK